MLNEFLMALLVGALSALAVFFGGRWVRYLWVHRWDGIPEEYRGRIPPPPPRSPRPWSVFIVFVLPVFAHAQEPAPNLRLSILGGSLASLSADVSGVVPFGRIGVEARLTESEAGPSLHVQGDLTADPGESLGIEDPQTFRGIEFQVSASQPLPKPLLFSVHVNSGFASRLPSEPKPRDVSAKWVSGGLLFQARDRAHRLTLGIGRDQRLNGKWVTAIEVGGHAKLREVKGVSVYFVGSAILSLETLLPRDQRYAGYSPPRDSVRVGIGIGL